MGRHAAGISRRELLLSLPALAALPLARRVVAQAPPLRARALNHMTLSVSDPKRSIEFYQGLLGMPIQARQGPATLLRIGAGPQFLAISPADGTAPRISHLGMAIENFNVDRVVSVLNQHGVIRADAASSDHLSGGPMKVRVRTRDGTPEVFFGDPDGIVVQLQDVSYCGGSGPLGATCGVSPPASKGLLAVRDLSHFTIMGVASPQKSNEFYQALFGFPIRANQGASPLLGVGPGVQFVMFTGGAAGRGRGGDPAAGAPAPPRPSARIDHACLSLEGFDVDKILKTLESFGIKPQATGQPRGPLMSWVSLRMENRGGAPGTGTPELYFSDPDGLSIQLQDVKYCGGGGYLGDVCLA